MVTDSKYLLSDIWFVLLWSMVLVNWWASEGLIKTKTKKNVIERPSQAYISTFGVKGHMLTVSLERILSRFWDIWHWIGVVGGAFEIKRPNWILTKPSTQVKEPAKDSRNCLKLETGIYLLHCSHLGGKYLKWKINQVWQRWIWGWAQYPEHVKTGNNLWNKIFCQSR